MRIQKHFVLCILCHFAMAPAISAEEGQTDYYDVIYDELASEGDCENGCCKEYFKSGLLAVEGCYKDSSPWEGVYRQYDENGTLLIDVVYKQGKLLNRQGKPYNGVFKSYYANGNQLNEANYKDGLLDGKDLAYYPNGTLQSDVLYKEGKLDGVTKMYFDNGKLEYEQLWEMENLISSKKYNENGMLVDEQ